MVCPECQTDLPDNANFCLKCGYAFGKKENPPKPSHTPDAERRRITALFSDLSGYTSITEKLDPEDVKAITGSIFDRIREVINKYEGFIEKFAGDGVLALFGVPQAHEDDPTRAIRAALEIHEMVEALTPRYERKLNRPLSMHSGIDTCLAIISDVNPDKGTHGVTSDATNVAARLSDLAAAGEILVGYGTYKTTQNHFTFQSLKPTAVKGKSKPIQAYKLMPEKVVSADVHQKIHISTEMVGRDQELAKLELHILKVVNGQGSVVNIFGEPGIGKSRLLAELRKGDVISRVSFLEGRSIAIGKNFSFHPIIDLFKHWAKIREDDSKIEASNKLEFAIRSVCDDDADEVFPFVATMMGMKLTDKPAKRIEGIEGEALEKLIFKNVRELLARSTELIPIVIVMEDLHWADSTSLEFLESLLRLALSHRVVFINVFRPGYWHNVDRKMETIPHWLPDVDFVEISLKPLDKQTGETLIDNILQVKGLQFTLKQLIVERAGGNPFFIEEVIRSLFEEGAIVRTNGAFEVTDKINHAVIPSTINDVLLARIDRLEEQTRELIKVASVIGRSFFDRILKEVAVSIDGVDDRLAYLKDVQFFRDRMRMEELEYLFKHALAQEAAYESTLLQQRKMLHKKIAKSIENIFRERLHEFYGMLAFHYSRAEEAEKVEEYMMKAGEEALRSSASNEALYYFQEALKHYLMKYGADADPAKLALFEKNIAKAFHNKAQWVEALEYLEKVLKRWGYPVPQRGFVETIRFAWGMLKMLKALYWRLPKSKKLPSDQDKEALDLFLKSGQALTWVDSDRQFLIMPLFFRHINKFDLYKIPKLPEYLLDFSTTCSAHGIFWLSKRYIDISKRFIPEDEVATRIKRTLAQNFLLCYQADWKKITDFNHEILNDSLRIGDLLHAELLLWIECLVKGGQGEFEHLMELVDKSYEIGEIYAYDQSIIHARLHKVDYLVNTRQLHEAISESQQGISFTREMGNEFNQIMFFGLKAEAQQLSGDPEGARETIKQATEIYEKQQIVLLPVFCASFVTARFFIDVSQLQHSIRSKNTTDMANIRRHACKSGQAAVKISRKYAPYRTKVMRLMGLYNWLIGKQRKALNWWGKAIQEGEHLDARPELSRTYFEVGKHLLEANSKYSSLNGIGAKAYLEKAKIMFTDMDLQWDLEQLEKVISI